jgi:hypothetical protein
MAEQYEIHEMEALGIIQSQRGISLFIIQEFLEILLTIVYLRVIVSQPVEKVNIILYMITLVS